MRGNTEVSDANANPNTIFVLNGPNLNLLGKREPELYGTVGLAQIEADLRRRLEGGPYGLRFEQTNDGAEALGWIHEHMDRPYAFCVINPGAWTHTSVALRDAFLGVRLPFVEVHLTNFFAREPFRRHSYLSDVAEGVICGLGADGYACALDYVVRRLRQRDARSGAEKENR